MPVPLYRATAAFFPVLGHPGRIRVLELLPNGPKPVRDLLAETGIEPAGLSQQPAVLRPSGIVTATRHGTTAVSAPAGGDVAGLMRAARRILIRDARRAEPAAGRAPGIAHRAGLTLPP